MDDKEKILRIHIGKTGGGTIGTIININSLNDYVITKHGKGFSLSKNIPQKHIIISLRDPITKFISAFNWRKGRIGVINSHIKNPRLPKKTRDTCLKEKKYLQHFKIPNNLAEALNTHEKKSAIDAMNSIVHVARTIEMYVGGIETLQYLYENGTKFYIINTENLIEDTKKVLKNIMKNVYKKEIDIKITTSRANTSNKTKQNTFMSTIGSQNLKEYLKKDIECIEYLNKVNEIKN